MARDDAVEETAAELAQRQKKALLVYKSNQQSASDDDEDDEEEEEEEVVARTREDRDVDEEDDDDVDDDEEDARSVRSESNSVEEDERVEDDDDDVDENEEEEEEELADEEEDDDVQVEKDDDESVNVPSDDDLDSTGTPRHRDESDDDVDMDDDAKSEKSKDDDNDTEDSEGKSTSPSIGTTKTNTKHNQNTNNSKLNVEEIIAARRRTGAKKECEVCHEARNGRRAMLCASCKAMYHSSCYRKKYSKLITAMGKQWFCPDCEPVQRAAVAAAAASPDKGDFASTPRKKKSGGGGGSSHATGDRESGLGKSGRSGKGHVGVSADAIIGGLTGGSLVEQELTRVTDIAMRGGRKINALVLERTEEMVFLTESLSAEVGRWSSGVASPTQVEKTSGEHASTVAKSVTEGLVSLKHMLQQLQVAAIQFEIDLVRDIKVPPTKDEPSTKSSGASTSARKSSSSAARSSGGGASGSGDKSGGGGGSSSSKVKSGASRLYSAKQIQKLEEWYQKSSRPEATEIQAMYRIINSPEYADKELQPDGISVKQIRIWFDNRRAKERLDYMRIKMKDISTADMEADDVKRMKAAYIDEAKEVLEARVSRLKENGKTVPLIDEADTLLLQSSERPLPLSKSTKASPAVKSGGASASSGKDAAGERSGTTNQKKRIRIDYVASVRKAMKDARDAGKSEDELKAIKAAAIERARERLHVPYKNSRSGPTKPLGKEEVSYIKMTMLKLLEEDAPAEELTDVVELLLSVIIPRDILIESQLHRQLNLLLKAHKDNKELVKQTNRLLDEFNTIIEKGDDVEYDDAGTGHGTGLADDDHGKRKHSKKDTNLLLSVDSESLPGTPGASPDSPGVSPDARKARVKFSREQLMKLERHFHKDDTPSKKNLEKLSKKLNSIAARDPSCEGQDRIDYKQIRSWFYKRRSTNQPPQALTPGDLRDIEAAGTASSSSSENDTESDSNDEAAATPAKPTKGKATAAAAKRKAAVEEKPPANKRRKKGSVEPAAPPPAPVEAKAPARPAASSSASKKDSSSKQHSGRIFNVKQLATIIEEYEKNPRPSVARLEELQKILNQDDHADDHFVNALGVTKRQIKTWFSNRRAKERLEVIRMKVQPTNGGTPPPHDSDSDNSSDDDAPARPAKASGSAKKELFTSTTQKSDSEDVDNDDDDDDDDDGDEDVDMGSDSDGGDAVDKDSESDSDSDSDDDVDE